MSAHNSDMKAIARMLSGKNVANNTAPTGVLVGTIKNINSDGTVDVYLAGGNSYSVSDAKGNPVQAGQSWTIPHVSRYSHYAPVVGDVVDLLQVSGVYRVMGRLVTQATHQWTNLTLQNSATTFPGWQVPQYFLDGNGFVHLRGLVETPPGTAGPSVGWYPFTLPVGTGSSSSSIFAVMTGSGMARFDMLTNGQFQLQGPPPGLVSPAQSTWVVLDGVKYSTHSA